MANYSLNETQTTAILDAIAIIKETPVKESNPGEGGMKNPIDLESGLIEKAPPVVTANLKSVMKK